MTPVTAVHHARAGWTLIELLVGLVIAAILVSLSYPSFKAIILRIHRGDALAALAQVELQQHRFRSNRANFATLNELGFAQLTAGGRYRLQDLATPTANGFLILASAQGPQADDLPCSHFLLEIDGAQTRIASGPDAQVRNGESDNLRCWGR